MLGELFGKCSVHKVRLLEAEVKVRYGLIRFPEDYLGAKKHFFPNAHSFVLGGCRVSPTNPKVRKVRYCPRCREGEKAWHEAHPRE
jgi:hypothetical protein